MRCLVHLKVCVIANYSGVQQLVRWLRHCVKRQIVASCFVPYACLALFVAPSGDEWARELNSKREVLLTFGKRVSVDPK